MNPKLLSLLFGLAIPALSQNELCSTVPPPACLYTCIEQIGECNLCTADGAANVTACIGSTCVDAPLGDKQYAYIYNGCICPNGGFQDYRTDPPHFETVPPSNCTA